MNIFSKILSGKYTKFLVLLTVFSLLNNSCSADTSLSETNSVTTKSQTNTEKKDSIAEFMQNFTNVNISKIKKPFRDYPGYWQQIEDFDVTITNTEENDEFPSESFSLKSLKGNVAIVFFTTTWCPNCVKVFQDLDNLHRKLADKKILNVKIITLVLGMDDDNTVKDYYKTNGIKSLRRFKSVSPVFFNFVRAIPSCFVFNKKTIPVWGFSGIANYGSLEFLNFIDELSKED